MAEYREHLREIQLAGGSVAAVSVDAPEQSEALRVDLALTFPILCDTERRVVREWGIYNAAERGGIAGPAVFVIDSGRVVRFASVDTVVRRVSAAEILSLLQNTAGERGPRRRVHVPRFSEWRNTIRNLRQR